MNTIHSSNSKTKRNTTSPADVTQYVTVHDITLAFLKIMIVKKGISLDQISKVSRLSKSTIEDILNNRPGSQMTINTLYVILQGTLRMSMGSLDEVIKLAIANLTIAHNIRVSEVKNSFRLAKRLPQRELESKLADPVTIWAYSKGHITHRMLA